MFKCLFCARTLHVTPVCSLLTYFDNTRHAIIVESYDGIKLFPVVHEARQDARARNYRQPYLPFDFVQIDTIRGEKLFPCSFLGCIFIVNGFFCLNSTWGYLRSVTCLVCARTISKSATYVKWSIIISLSWLTAELFVFVSSIVSRIPNQTLQRWPFVTMD